MKMMRNIMRSGLAAMAFVLATPSYGTIAVTQNTNIAGGMAAFGPSVTAFDWNNGTGAPGTATGGINITHWIDGPGFDNGINPAFDLAINGIENVTWNFSAPVSRIGFAMATGLGRFPSEFDHLGATFNLLTSNGDMGVISLIDGGSGYAAWIEISSTTPFSSLSFTEVGSNIQDQYWGNVLSAAVPEPASWALMIAGFGLVGGVMRRRAVQVSYAA
jgi:PEP-CTERM motif